MIGCFSPDHNFISHVICIFLISNAEAMEGREGGGGGGMQY